jgi:hypothetical protein
VRELRGDDSSHLSSPSGIASAGGGAAARGRATRPTGSEIARSDSRRTEALFGVAPRDPAALAAALLALALAACAAIVLPAVRATRIDPVRALRAD